MQILNVARINLATRPILPTANIFSHTVGRKQLAIDRLLFDCYPMPTTLCKFNMLGSHHSHLNDSKTSQIRLLQ